MSATEHGRQVARHVARILGATPQVRRSTWNGHTADILLAADIPKPGVTTLATVTLSQRNAIVDGTGRDFGVELITCYDSCIVGCQDAFFDAAFLTVAHREELYPGAVLPELIGRRRISSTMRHFFLTTPFLWDELVLLDTGDRPTRYLLAVPISDAEMALAGTEGSEALDDLLERQQINIFDWNRPSTATI